MIGKMPTIAAMAYKYSIGQPFIYPRNELKYSANFLHMCFAVPSEGYEVDPALASAMRQFFILHADHEQSASTATVRLAGSSGANPYACISAGIACLWGPVHGGATEAVLLMLKEIGSVDRIPEYVKRAKDESDPFQLMGFGYRVYKTNDPRAKIMRKALHEVLETVGRHNRDNPLFKVAVELERVALSDGYFVEKRLSPNLDFYSAITLKALGFPTEMFTVLYAIARTAGWIAHWKEMIDDPAQRIGRPRSSILEPPSAPTCRWKSDPSGRLKVCFWHRADVQPIGSQGLHPAEKLTCLNQRVKCPLTTQKDIRK